MELRDWVVLLTTIVQLMTAITVYKSNKKRTTKRRVRGRR
jgi:hypothetical protein